MPNGYRTPKSGQWNNPTNRDLTPFLKRKKRKSKSQEKEVKKAYKICSEVEKCLFNYFTRGETFYSVPREKFNEHDIKLVWKKFVKNSTRFKSKVNLNLFLPLRDEKTLMKLLNEGNRYYSGENFLNWCLNLFFYNLSNEAKIHLARILMEDYKISQQTMNKYLPGYKGTYPQIIER